MQEWTHNECKFNKMYDEEFFNVSMEILLWCIHSKVLSSYWKKNIFILMKLMEFYNYIHSAMIWCMSCEQKTRAQYLRLEMECWMFFLSLYTVDVCASFAWLQLHLKLEVIKNRLTTIAFGLMNFSNFLCSMISNKMTYCPIESNGLCIKAIK